MPRARSLGEPPPALYEVDVVRDARIPTIDAQTTLSADVYRPLCEDPVPALVTVLPYRKDLEGGELANSLRWFAARGYGSVLVDHAGIGSSDGTPHAPWGPGESDDAIAAIDWVRAQPWCDGAIGLWGHSHGGFTSMRTACRRPPGLKAIVPIMNALDVERDIMHPAGARGDLARLASWGGMMLVQQLLPPLLNHSTPQEQRRWRRRLSDTVPFVMELAGLGPGDPAWRDRVIDARSITVPTLCVGGWHDIYPDAVWRAFQQIPAPKRLLMGPWGHTLPQASPTAPIDFLPIMLRWWDHWLRGVDNGVMDEPPVTLYVRGARPGWRTYTSWLPPGQAGLTLTAGPGGTLTAYPRPGPTEVIAEYEPDPTTGTASGLAGVGFGSLAPPLDQYEDDMRSVAATSAPLLEELLIIERPTVVVQLASVSPAGGAQRLVVRLADIDPSGGSTFISAGTTCPVPGQETVQIALDPTAYRVAAGHRLRVALTDSDFPRLTPLPAPTRLPIVGLELSLPTAPEGEGRSADVPAIGIPVPEAAHGGSYWSVIRDPLHNGIEVKVATSTGGVLTDQGHLLERTTEIRAAVLRASPAAATTTGNHRARVRLATGDDVAITGTVRCTHTTLWVHGEITVNGTTTFSRNWETPLAPARHDTALAAPVGTQATAPGTPARSTNVPQSRHTA